MAAAILPFLVLSCGKRNSIRCISSTTFLMSKQSQHKGYGVEGDIVFSMRNVTKMLDMKKKILDNVSLGFFKV